jgi:copper chaperone
MKIGIQKLMGIWLTLALISYSGTRLKSQTSEKTKAKIEVKTQKTLKFEVEGMSCQAGCANGLDNTFKNTKGITKSKTSFDESLTEITYDETKISEKEIIQIIEKRGFSVRKL